MEFMTTEGDRSGIGTFTKKQKAKNILYASIIYMKSWEQIFDSSSTETSLAVIADIKNHLDTIERLLKNDNR